MHGSDRIQEDLNIHTLETAFLSTALRPWKDRRFSPSEVVTTLAPHMHALELGVRHRFPGWMSGKEYVS
jgi:hypothetical protein